MATRRERREAQLHHVALTAVDTSRAETLHLSPVFLPDGIHFLYLRVSNDQSRTGLYVGSIDAGPADQDQTRLLATVNMAVYAPAQGAGPGHVLFLRDGLLVAQPFDERARQAIGEASPVTAERIFAYNFLAAMSASANGTLIFLRGSTSSGTLTSVDRSGKATPLLPGVVLDTPRYLRVSPDGRRVAMVVGGQLWAYELDGRPPIKLTFGDERVYSSVWTKDGRRLVYERDAGAGSKTVFAVAADGSGSAPEALWPDGHYHPHGWSADGRAIVATRVGNNTSDLVRVTADPAGQVQDIVATPHSEGNSASVSPDGRWLAYTTDSTGRSEIWVRPLDRPGASVRVTPNGGIEPVWARDGREIYYLLGSKVMAVPVDTSGAAFGFEPPIELFTSASVAVPGDTPPSYDVTPDGRFIMLTRTIRRTS